VGLGSVSTYFAACDPIGNGTAIVAEVELCYIGQVAHDLIGLGDRDDGSVAVCICVYWLDLAGIDKL
jgi:hypothetical protein